MPTNRSAHRSKSTAGRIVAGLVAAGAAAAMLPGSASAATVEVVTSGSSSQLNYNDRFAQDNSVRFEPGTGFADSIRVTDRVALQVGRGCRLESATVATCSANSVGATRINRLVVEAGGGQDIVDRRNVVVFGHLRGGDGPDLLMPGRGQDFVIGGPGADMVSYQDSLAVHVTLNSPSGVIDDGPAGEQDDVREVESVLGSVQSDFIAQHGNSSDPLTLSGNSGNDSLNGLNGADRLNGSGGSDTLRGGGGNDRLLARDGVHDPVIDCGPGALDVAEIDLTDPNPTGCETVSRSPKNTTTVTLRPLAGATAARVSCSRKANARCTGIVTLARGNRSLGSRRFALDRGAGTMVRFTTRATGALTWHSAQRDAQGRPMTVQASTRA